MLRSGHAAFLASLQERLPFESMEEMLTAPDGFALTTATPLQRAICRVIQGLPLQELWLDPTVPPAFGGAKPLEEPPDELCILSGIRCAKSLIAACAGVWASQTCDLVAPKLKPGDIPRVSIVSLNTDVAKPVYDHLVRSIQYSRRLARLMLGEPTADAVLLKHPSGRPIEVKVVAGARAGGTLVARWSAGVIFDEAPRMVGEGEAKINLDHERDSVRAGRLLDGCLIMYIGSPWAPTGPVYNMYTENFGKPTKSMVVVKTPAWTMNPVWWTPKRIAAKRKNAPDAARTDIDAEFRDAETSLFNSVSLIRSTREKPLVLDPEEGADYSVGMDPATRGNAWTLVMLTKRDGKIRMVLGMQWQGTKAAPLSPQGTMKEIAEILLPYGCNTLCSDQLMGDALKDFGLQEGLCLYTENMGRPEQVRQYTSLASRIDAGLVELAPNEHMLTDLRAVKKRATADGARIVLPRTGDGRHADYAPAFVLAAGRWLDEPVEIVEEEELDESEEAELEELAQQEQMMYGEDDFEEQGAEW